MSSSPLELKNTILRAGAGAGKTWELTERVLKMAQLFREKHQRYPRLIVTTYTRKATQELKERLLLKAMQWQDSELVKFVKSPSQLHISTIHGVLSLFLGQFGSRMGLSPQVNIVDDQKSIVLIKRSIRKLCEADAVFSEKLQSILENISLSDLIQAIETYREALIQYPSLQPYDAFSEEQRIETESKNLLSEFKRVSTELRNLDLTDASLKWCDYVDKSVLTAQNSSSDFWQNFTENLPAVRKSKNLDESWIEIIKELKEKAQSLACWNTSTIFWQQHNQLADCFEYCSKQLISIIYHEKMRKAELTMSDLETFSLKLLSEYPEAGESFSKTCDYWFIDEYQDTSPIQVQILDRLVGKSSRFVVGDPQQSIYLFRGARSEVFDQQESLIKDQGGELLSKTINYRSDSSLLEFFNQLFSKVGTQFRSMQPDPDKIPAKIDQEVAQVLLTENTEKEAALVRCQELLAAGVPAEEICILSRGNEDLDQIAILAKKYQIPVQRHSSGKFYERREIIDACSLLRFLCNPHDNKNLILLLRTPYFLVSDQLIYEWSQSAGKSYWNLFKQKEHPSIANLKQAVQDLRVQGLGFVWKNLLITSGFFQNAEIVDPSGQKEANLWKLIHMIQTAERQVGFSHLEFLNEVQISADNTEDKSDGDSVPVVAPAKIHLMTVHASKGLQFSHIVYLSLGKTRSTENADFFMFDEKEMKWTLSIHHPDDGKKCASILGDQILRQTNKRAEAEVERIFYVALTRAKKTVTITFPEKPKKNTLAASWPLSATEGSFQEGLCTYTVRKQEWCPVLKEESQNSSMLAMSRFSRIIPKRRSIVSVTSLLTDAEVGKLSGSLGSGNFESKTESIKKALTGVSLHRLFENIKYYGMQNSAFQWQELLSDLTDQERTALEYLAKDQDGRWLKLIKNGEVEDGIAVLIDDNLIQGQIDLWGSLSLSDSGSEVWVVDYKSGSEKYQDKAFAQLEIYAWALRSMNKIGIDQKVNLAVIYPLAQKTFVRTAMDFQTQSLNIKKKLETVGTSV